MLLLHASPAGAQDRAWAIDHGQWEIAPSVKQMGHPTIMNDGREMARLRVTGSTKAKEFDWGWQTVSDGVRVVTKRKTDASTIREGYSFHEKRPIDVTAEYALRDGVLHCRYTYKEGGKDAPFALRIELPGHYAGTEAQLDGQAVTLNGEVAAKSVREVALYPGVPSRRFAIRAQDGRLALEQGQANGGDFVLRAEADAGRPLHLVFDFSKAKLREVAAGYPGSDFITRDDLHLLDQTLSRNLVQNPSFAAGFAHWSWGITAVRNEPDGKPGWYEEEGTSWDGDGRSARYIVREGWNADQLCTFPIAAKAGDTYTVSFYAKTDTPGAKLGVLAQTVRWGIFPLDKRVELTTEWTRYEFQLESPYDFFRVGFGDRWWDDNKPGQQVDGAQIWLDGVQIERSNTTTDFTQKPIVAYTYTEAIDNVYEVSEAKKPVHVAIVNTTASTARVEVDASLQDLERRPLLQKRVMLDLPAHGRERLTFDLAELEYRGLVRVVVKTESAEHQETFYGRAGVFERITDPGRVRYAYQRDLSIMRPINGGPRYYVTQMDPTSLRQRMRDYGAWGALSFRPPEDATVVEKLGEEDMLFIFSVTTGDEDPEGMNRKLVQLSPKLSEEQWAAYERAVAARVRQYPRQKFWKTINEPGGPSTAWDLADHVRAIAIQYRHIKSMNPDAVVLSPEMATSTKPRQAWLEEFLQAGGKDVVDAIAIHTYRDRPEDPSLIADIEALNALRKAYGLDKHPIYMTEGEGRGDYVLNDIGLAPTRSFAEYRLKRLSYDLGQGELTSAAIHTRTLLACFRYHDDVGMYLTWTDDVEDGQPRASLFTVNQLYALLRNATFREEYLIGENTRTYLFERPDGVPVAVLWSYDLKVDQGDAAPPQASIKLPASGWRLLDMMGNPLQPEVSDGTVAFPVSGRPVYLVGEGMEKGGLAQALSQATIGDSGIRSVDLRVRMTSPSAAVVHVDNRLLRRTEGRLVVEHDGKALAEQPIDLSPRGTDAVAFELPAVKPGEIAEASITFRFTDAETGKTVERPEQLRWFAVPRIEATPTIDGRGDEWAGVPAITLGAHGEVLPWKKDASWGGTRDLSATVRHAWRPDGLYMLVEVTDDAFSQKNVIENAWRGDSIQTYIDLFADGRDRPNIGYDDSDHDVVVTELNGKDTSFRIQSPVFQIGFVTPGITKDVKAAVHRENDVTTYEVHFPLSEIQPLTPKAGLSLGWALLVNDADEDGVRKQSVATTPAGIQPYMRPESWPIAVLIE